MSFVPLATSGVIALYHLADVNDSSGNSHTLTNNNTVTFGTGQVGSAAIFGSTNSSKYLSHADGLGKDLSGDASISAWFMVQTDPSSGEFQCFVRWGSTTGTARYFGLFYTNVGGTKKIVVRCSGTTIDSNNVTYTVSLTLNVWYKLDVNISSTCEAFLNGVSIGTVSRGTGTTTSDAVSIGSYNAGDYFKGNVGDVVFFNTVRSAVDIRRRYAFERGMLV